jgi:hypothetical protein
VSRSGGSSEKVENRGQRRASMTILQGLFQVCAYRNEWVVTAYEARR